MKNTTSSFLIFTVVLLTITSCSTTRKINRSIDESFKTSEAFESGFSGFVLYDPEENELIYEHNGGKYFTPASNIKLLTFFTGLKILGDSVPALKYIIRDDSLIFWGTADPSFLHPNFAYSKVYEFLNERKEQLFYAEPIFSEEHFGPGWAWDDYNGYYSAERGAFPIYGNTVRFIFRPKDSVPTVIPQIFQDSIKKEEHSEEKESGAVRNISKNFFVFRHQKGNERKVQEIPFKYSPELVVQLLSDTLQRPVQLIKHLPRPSQKIQTLYSVPTDSLYKQMLQQSDNFIAEQLLLMSAQKISDSLKAEIVIEYMKKKYLKDLPNEPIWVDGSGLSIYNKLTPRTVVKLLEKIQEEIPNERLFELLAIGGKSGTLKNRYPSKKPYIFAKTGSLSNTNILSGFLRGREGKLLIFSFMNNNHTAPSSKIRDEMEKILRNIYLNY